MERSRRLSAYQSPPDWRRDTWHELLEAFEFRLVGEATQDGQSASIIDAIWVGWFLVRVAAGSRVTLELARVDDGVWMPDRLQVFASARLGLLKAWRIDQQVRYSRYNSVSEVARKIHPAEDPDARSAGLNRFAKAASP